VGIRGGVKAYLLTTRTNHDKLDMCPERAGPARRRETGSATWQIADQDGSGGYLPPESANLKRNISQIRPLKGTRKKAERNKKKGLFL
jgi:hypothetical protein